MFFHSMSTISAAASDIIYVNLSFANDLVMSIGVLVIKILLCFFGQISEVSVKN